MKRFFKYVKQDKIIKLSVQISGVLLLGQLIYIGISYFSLPPVLPLFNQLPWGEERLGQQFEIFIPAILVLLVIIGNILLLNRLYEEAPLVSRILAITTLIVSLLAFIFTIQTINILI